MSIYKISDRFLAAKRFSGFVFDCDGVLIDASKSYDLALKSSAEAFASLLGMKFDENQFGETVEALRELGTFNNDWDSLAVIVADLYGKANDTSLLDSISSINPLAERLKKFEESVISRQTRHNADFDDLLELIRSEKEGTKRDEIIAKILPGASIRRRLYDVISYPKPVGEGLLATLFDEVVYGRSVFKATYGIDCVTQRLSVPGLITHERKLVEDETLSSLSKASGGRLGIITGRPRVPTMHTLGTSYCKWFLDPEICLFTGDYMLNTEEVKPSPKPMLRVASKLSKSAPIAYVGDSGEDLMMAKNANATLDGRVYFVGIATSEEKREFFEKHGENVDCLVSNVNELASMMKDKLSLS